MDVMIDKTFNQQCMVADPKVDYGYGDATPSTTDYGYGDAAPSSSTTASNDAATPGYGETTAGNTTAATDYGYGSADANQYGYGDSTSGGSGGGEALRRRERPRRRGSVTKYSLDATQELKNQQTTTQTSQQTAAASGGITFQPPAGTYDDGRMPLNDAASATPNPGVGIMRNSRRKKNSSSPADDYGYGTAAPDSAAAQNPHAYGDAAPNPAPPDKYGYGDASNDASKYGYGDASTDANKYGYGETEYKGLNDVSKSGSGDTSNDANKYGYGDASSDGGVSGTSAESGSGGEPRRRPRRRGSVTKYSLEVTEAVATEYQIPLPPLPPQEQPLVEEFMVTLKDAPDRQNSAPMSDDEMSCDDSVDAMSCEGDEEGGKKKKKKKKKRFGRFRIGKSRSGLSQGSKGSVYGED
jgi:hypothetical protein